MTDSELKREIETALHRETRLQGRDIAVAVDNGTIVLKGQVNEVAEKRLAMNLVRQMGEVKDQLRLFRTSDMTDAQIRQHIVDAWQEDSAVHERAIDCTVQDGVVTIDGQLDSIEEKAFAGVLAWWVPGVTDVDNRIELVPANEANDGDLLDIVRQVLAKDPLVNSDMIGLTARDGVITLEGSARNEEERQAAEHDAYYVLGVSEVINNLIISSR
jgi:osmotically-inducible protein OsmY